MPKVTVQPGQSLFDIAVKYYGTAEGVFDLVCRNRLNGLTQNIYPGDELEVTNRPLNLRISTFLAPHQVATIEEAIRGRGIGYEPLVSDSVSPQPYHFKVAETPLTRVAFEVRDADAPAGITYAQGRFWIINSHGDLQVLATGVYFDSQKIYTATRSGRPRLLVFDAEGTLLEEGFTLSQRATVAGIAVARGQIYIATSASESNRATSLRTYTTTISVYALGGTEDEASAIVLPNFEAGGLTFVRDYLYLLGKAYEGPVSDREATGKPIVEPISI